MGRLLEKIVPYNQKTEIMATKNTSAINLIAKDKPNIVLIGMGSGNSALYHEIKSRLAMETRINCIALSSLPDQKKPDHEQLQDDVDMRFLLKKLSEEPNEFSVLVVGEEVQKDDVYDHRAMETIIDVTSSLMRKHERQRIKLSAVLHEKFISYDYYTRHYKKLSNELGFYLPADEIASEAVQKALANMEVRENEVIVIEAAPKDEHISHGMPGFSKPTDSKVSKMES